MNNIELKILLAEDEPTIRYVAEKQFKALGYKLTEIAEDGILAVEKALAAKFDLIFMDVNMPGIDGILATQQIRQAQQKSGSYTPIIGMTAFVDKKLCMDAGMDDFLQKPVLLNDLKGMIDKWMSTKVHPLQRCNDESQARFQISADDTEWITDRISNLRKRSGLE